MLWPGKLTPWLKRVCFATDKGALTKLELRQVVNGSPDSMVDSWLFNEDTPKTEIEDLATEITARAQGDCEEAYDGPTQYTVLAFFDGNEVHDSRAPATRFESSHRSDGSGFEESEPATAKGINSQQMRHNEVLVRMMVANTASMQQHAERVLERAYSRIHHLEEDRYKMIEMAEGMLNERSKRELAEAAERDKLLRYDEAWQSARVLLPTVVNKLAGKNLLPEKTTPTDEIVIRLIGSLTPDQFAKIQSVLDPMQIAGFGELAAAALKKEDARKAEDQKAKDSKVVAIKKADKGGGSGG